MRVIVKDDAEMPFWIEDGKLIQPYDERGEDGPWRWVVLSELVEAINVPTVGTEGHYVVSHYNNDTDFDGVSNPMWQVDILANGMYVGCKYFHLDAKTAILGACPPCRHGHHVTEGPCGDCYAEWEAKDALSARP